MSDMKSETPAWMSTLEESRIRRAARRAEFDRKADARERQAAIEEELRNRRRYELRAAGLRLVLFGFFLVVVAVIWWLVGRHLGAR